MVDATLNLLMSLFSYGITGGIIRIYHEEPPERKRLVIGTSVGLLWIGCLAVTLPMLLFARPFSLFILGDAAWSPYLGIALLTFTLDLTGQAAGTILVIEQRSVAYSMISLVRLVLGLGLNIWLILGLGMGLHGYFIAAFVTAAFAAVVYHVIAFRRCGAGYDRVIARKLLAFEPRAGNLVSLPRDRSSAFSFDSWWASEAWAYSRWPSSRRFS
jgi:O-antigen/teichoic acid export membrane protein